MSRASRGGTSSRVRRRHPLSSRDESARAVAKLGTYTARAMFVAVESGGDIDYSSQLALVSMAHVLDMRPGETVVYPEDVADAIGCSVEKAGTYLRALVKADVVKGSFAAGYTLAGLMLAPES